MRTERKIGRVLIVWINFASWATLSLFMMELYSHHPTPTKKNWFHLWVHSQAYVPLSLTYHTNKILHIYFPLAHDKQKPQKHSMWKGNKDMKNAKKFSPCGMRKNVFFYLHIYPSLRVHTYIQYIYSL